jgi:hypothetical protein
MVYNTQNYWVFGINPLSGILKNIMNLFPLWGVRAGRIVYSRPHVACSFCPDIHTTMRSASGAWRVGWSAALSVGRDLATDEDSVAAAAE